MKAYPFSNPHSEIVIEAIMPLGMPNIIRTLAKLSSPTIADVIGDLAAQSSIPYGFPTLSIGRLAALHKGQL